MADYRRHFLPGGIYFFTVVTANRTPVFRDPAAVQRLRTAMRQVKAVHPFRIDAMVVLPDHLHAIWTLPPGDPEFSKRWRLIKYRVSLHLCAPVEGRSSLRKKREKGIWQRRFWEHTIRDEEDRRRHIDYIHYNPVKHGLVGKPGDWSWSSFRRYVARGIYPADWGTGEEPGWLSEMDLE